MTKSGGDHTPLSFGQPMTITSEPGQYKGVRHQRVRLGPDMWITVHEDGRLTLGSYTHAFTVTYLHQHKQGAGVSLSTRPILAAEESPGADEPPAET
jgi:hypothetical protein